MNPGNRHHQGECSHLSIQFLRIQNRDVGRGVQGQVSQRVPNFERLVFTVIGASSVRVVLICGRMTQAAMFRHSTWPEIYLHLERHNFPA